MEVSKVQPVRQSLTSGGAAAAAAAAHPGCGEASVFWHLGTGTIMNPAALLISSPMWSRGADGRLISRSWQTDSDFCETVH